MQAIWHDRLPIAEIVNAKVISLEDAPTGYKDFDKGAAVKFVLDPHGIVARAANIGQADNDEPQRPSRETSGSVRARGTRHELAPSLLLSNSVRDDVIWLSATMTRGS